MFPYIPFITFILVCVYFDVLRILYPNSRIQQINFNHSKIFILVSLANLIVGSIVLSFIQFNYISFTLWEIPKLLIIFFLGDTSFYWSHRLLHIPSIYKISHKIHHTHISPISWTSLYVDPLEFILALSGIFILPPIIFNTTGISLITVHIYWSCIMFALVSSHSGLNIPWFCSAEHHNKHHQNYNFNYGSDIGIWDKLCNTCY